ncbi:hypothetical protein MCOR07_003916 [Pyricularia oryzae]|nr:hypothetical protein MCOR01_002198 [Pyricularia oryzae]KAI6288267.1 hypothetical protein MCOR26_000269 [Pyricularia oryzae]KAI6347812.1 hypothetical protein MCOR28_002159 [Pyricularia oryzae]KAI6399988.1 hypothetical protein MCOR24_008678 [Pyricularia oryzae]KAI6492523.1 hypothetical protein MCOR18_001778 [Pyricularia oryzae]
MVVDLKRQLESWIVDPQLGSPLFGRLPAEIRLDIFELALLTQDIFLDTWLKYKNADSCSEPPNLLFTHKRLSPTLLAICRRVFIEAHLLIFKNERGHQVEEQRFWKSWIPKSRPDSPEGKPGVDKSCIACAYWSRERTEWERRFTMLNFSGGLDYYQSFLSNQTCASPMEVLDQSAKKYQKAKSEGRLTSLGDSSSDPYSSKTLTMNFHCSENWRANFEVIIDYVVEMWRFPLNPHHAGYHYLAAEGNPARKLSWRGQMGHWEDQCPLFHVLPGRALSY